MTIVKIIDTDQYNSIFGLSSTVSDEFLSSAGYIDFDLSERCGFRHPDNNAVSIRTFSVKSDTLIKSA
jgi:hypothetical protein